MHCQFSLLTSMHCKEEFRSSVNFVIKTQTQSWPCTCISWPSLTFSVSHGWIEETGRGGGGDKDEEGEGMLSLPAVTFRSQRDMSQTPRIKLKDCATWRQAMFAAHLSAGSIEAQTILLTPTRVVCNSIKYFRLFPKLHRYLFKFL